MKIDLLDAHDRLKHFKKHNHSIDECCQHLIDQAPFGNRPFYIFAHSRTDDDGVKTRMIWQPRLTRPKAQTNSMLFKGHPGTDVIKVIWIIPKRELWQQFEKGKITENETVFNSIHSFIHNREALEMSDQEDPSDQEINAIYTELRAEAKRKKMMDKLYLPKQDSWVVC